MNTFRLGWVAIGFVSGTMVTAICTPVCGEIIRVVSPSSAKNVEGNTSASPGGPIRIQYLFPASDFAGLPASQRFIVAWNFRADQAQSQPLNWTMANERIWMSTTDKNSLTSVFANNHGPDKTLVHNGAISYPLLATGPPAGPREIADGTRLQTPFYYDPSKGNLIIERLTTDVAGPAIDVQSGAQVRVLLNPDQSSATGLAQFTELPVSQFEFAVPEPSAFVLAVLASLFAIVWRQTRCCG